MGGCSLGSAGSVCWVDWLVPLILLGLLVFVGIAVIAGIVSVVRNPRDALRYYSSKRSLVVLPLTFVGYMAAWIIIHELLWETHAPLWALLIAGIPLVGILSFGIWVARRHRRRPDGN